MNPTREEKTELRHDPEPGYQTIFYVVFGVATLYLVIMLVA